MLVTQEVMGKTMIEYMSIYHTCIWFPGIYISMSAQTKENAASLSREKHNDLMNAFPLLKNELIEKECHFSRTMATVKFKNNSTYDVLANAQSTKGQRRQRLNIEESALLNNALYKDALEPVVNVARRTRGQLSAINPWELNGMINFLTTTGYKNSTEYMRVIDMIDKMVNLEGQMVLGASWRLPCYYGRGENEEQILKKKNDPTSSYVDFQRNYEEVWVGAADDAIIDINKLMDCQNYPMAVLKPQKDKEYYLSVDVARSSKTRNNKSAFVVFEVERNSDNTIKNASVVNIVVPKNGLNFFDQSLIVKRLNKVYSFISVIVDANGVGSGLVDTLMMEALDPKTGETYPAWNTENTDDEPNGQTSLDSPSLYALKATGIQTKIIVDFIDFIESDRLKLLVPLNAVNLPEEDSKNKEEINSIRAAHYQTDQLRDQIANLRKVDKSAGNIDVEQVSKGTDKDIYSALVYGLYYLREFEDKRIEQNSSSLEELLDYTFFV